MDISGGSGILPSSRAPVPFFRCGPVCYLKHDQAAQNVSDKNTVRREKFNPIKFYFGFVTCHWGSLWICFWASVLIVTKLKMSQTAENVSGKKRKPLLYEKNENRETFTLGFRLIRGVTSKLSSLLRYFKIKTDLFTLFQSSINFAMIYHLI